MICSKHILFVFLYGMNQKHMASEAVMSGVRGGNILHGAMMGALVAGPRFYLPAIKTSTLALDCGTTGVNALRLCVAIDRHRDERCCHACHAAGDATHAHPRTVSVAGRRGRPWPSRHCSAG